MSMIVDLRKKTRLLCCSYYPHKKTDIKPSKRNWKNIDALL